MNGVIQIMSDQSSKSSLVQLEEVKDIQAESMHNGTKSSMHPQAVPLRKIYLKLVTISTYITKYLGVSIAIQLIYHGLFLVVFTAIVTNVRYITSKGESELMRNVVVLVAHAAIAFRVLQAAATLTEKAS